MKRKLYLFWFGKPMNQNRNRCYNTILKNSEVSVELISENNLNSFVIKEDPPHPGFVYLSDTHKSDYLRSYFMYHYGGGYSDIKECNFSWIPYFDKLEISDADFIGSAEKKQRDIAYKEKSHMIDRFVVCNQFIFKEKTNFAKKWIIETNKKMDNIFDQLIKNPGTYHPRAEFSGVQGLENFKTEVRYPLMWTELLGQIFHKLQFDNPNSFIRGMPYPNISNYR